MWQAAATTGTFSLNFTKQTFLTVKQTSVKRDVLPVLKALKKYSMFVFVIITS